MTTKSNGLLGVAEIAELYSVSKVTAATWSRRRDFPKPISQLAMGPVWSENDVRAWRQPIPKAITIHLAGYGLFATVDNPRCISCNQLGVEVQDETAQIVLSQVETTESAGYGDRWPAMETWLKFDYECGNCGAGPTQANVLLHKEEV
jgi:predicted DNA-binding transcriptional regulator AlpA